MRRQLSAQHRLGDAEGLWPCSWITLPEADRHRDLIAAYRCSVQLAHDAEIDIHYSGDQRFALYLDGERVDRGPERGSPWSWYYHSQRLALSAGEHVFVARVWSLDQQANHTPLAQMGDRHGFVLLAEGEWHPLLSTGVADWQGLRIHGITPLPPPAGSGAQYAGGRISVDAKNYSWHHEAGLGEGWEATVTAEPARERVQRRGGELSAHRLQPAALPPQHERRWRRARVVHIEAAPDEGCDQIAVDAGRHLDEELAPWQALLHDDVPLKLPAHCRRRAIIDLGDYCCAYPELASRGGAGAFLRLRWAEALFEQPVWRSSKGQRDSIAGKYLLGRGDEFHLDGERRTFETLWWDCGRYVEVFIETGAAALELDRLAFCETRYPLELASRIDIGDERFADAVPLMWRTLQMCSHETYMDCPYYEQLMYAGDTRLQALATYVGSAEQALPRKAIATFAASQSGETLIQSRFPSNQPQIIPCFALYWIGMLYDYARWRGDYAFVQTMLPRARAIAERFIASLDNDGLIAMPEGWDFVDWVPGWRNGIPPCDDAGRRSIDNWLLVCTLQELADIECWAGDEELGKRYRARAAAVALRCDAMFWNAERGCYADTTAHDSFSEHSQCFALLSNRLSTERSAAVLEALLTQQDFARCTIYTAHYLFAALGQAGRSAELVDRLGFWYQLREQGFSTTVEMPEPSRSDCHAWGAHPLYHAVTSLVGIQPQGFGFQRVRIAPQLGQLPCVEAALPHPSGAQLRVRVERDDEGLSVQVDLPAGVAGVLEYGAQRHDLRSGPQELTLQA